MTGIISGAGSPLRGIDPDEALRRVIEAAMPRRSRSVPLVEAVGLRLAAEVRADRPYPPFRRSMMDGFAVRLADAGRSVAVVGEVAAGDDSALNVADGHAVEIMTGAVCPPGTEAVVPKERVERQDQRVHLPDSIKEGHHIAPIGSDCEAGRLTLSAGDEVTPLAVAVMASFGLTSVRVVPRPSAAILITGREVVPAGRLPAPHQIRDSNGPMLQTLAHRAGITQLFTSHTDDDLLAIRQALETAADRDIVILTGGVSVGNHDLVPQAIDEHGAALVFHKVTQRPGRPMLLATSDDRMFFGLPGNPLAVHLGFDRYVSAAIRRMEGRPVEEAAFSARLTEPVQNHGDRTHFLLARAEASDSSAQTWTVTPLNAQSSGDIFTTCRANCYLRLPPGSPRRKPGETLACTWIGGPPHE